VKVLIIGGTGVLGLPTVASLAAAGHVVRATARNASKAAEVQALGATPVDVDVFDLGSLRAAIRDCDAVFRLTTKIPSSFAAMRSPSGWAETNRLRSVSSRLIVDAMRAENVGIYVTESFYAVYADAGDRLVDETCATSEDGLTVLHAALEGEAHAERLTNAGGRGVVLRFGGIYGPQVPATRQMFGLVRRRMLPLVGSGSFFFPSIHVADAAAALKAALELPAGLYNVVDDEPLRWKEFVQIMARAADAPAPLHVPGFMGGLLMGYPWQYLSRSLRLSNAKLKTLSPWRPRTPRARDGFAAIASTMFDTHEQIARAPVAQR
jgi:nucleoside-diphosphate-sugar epimerase